MDLIPEKKLNDSNSNEDLNEEKEKDVFGDAAGFEWDSIQSSTFDDWNDGATDEETPTEEQKEPQGISDDENEEKKDKKISLFILSDKILKQRKNSPEKRENSDFQLSKLVEIMKRAPIVTPSEEKKKDIHFYLFNEPLDFIFGGVPKELLSVYHKLHINEEEKDCTECNICASCDLRTVFLDATHVLNIGMTEFFNCLSFKEEKEQKELEFFEKGDEDVKTEPVIVRILFDLLDNYTKRVRKEWSATYVKMIHVLLNIFGNRRKELKTIIGNPEKFFNQRVLMLDKTSPYKNTDVVYRELIKGKCSYFYAFVYEILSLMVSNKFREKGPCRSYIYEMILNANYHQVRCAIDSVGDNTLYICLLSPSYFTEVWIPYMQLYHPHICPKKTINGDNEITIEDITEDDVMDTAPPPVFFQKLVFYYPSPEVFMMPDPKAIAKTVAAIFKLHVSAEFKEKVNHFVFPPNFPDRKITKSFLVIPEKTKNKRAITEVSSTSSLPSSSSSAIHSSTSSFPFSPSSPSSSLPSSPSSSPPSSPSSKRPRT